MAEGPLFISAILAQPCLFSLNISCFLPLRASCLAGSQQSPSPWCSSNILLTRFLPFSWCQLRAHTRTQPPSVLTTHRSCHHLWSAREASGTPDLRPSSECDLRVGRAASAQPRAGGGSPQPGPSPIKSLSCSPHAGGGSQENLDNDTETDSLVSAQRERPRRRDGPEHGISS